MSNNVYLFGYLGSGINHLRWLVLLAEEYKIPGLDDKLSGIANTAYGRNKWLKEEGSEWWAATKKLWSKNTKKSKIL